MINIPLISHTCILDTNPLREIYVSNGTDSSPPSVQCIFTDDLLITNEYSTGCLYYNISGGPVNVPRSPPDEPNVTTDIPNTLASYTGLICFVSVPLIHERCRGISIDSGIKHSVSVYLCILTI